MAANELTIDLTIKQKLFVEHYLTERNAFRAAKLAGYAGDDNTLRVVACENLAKPNIRAEIDRRLAPFILSSNEVLQGLSAIANADIAEVLEADGSLDLTKAHKRGVSRLIKSVAFDKDSGKIIKIELYSAHEAKRDLGKHRGLFPTRIELSKVDADVAAHQSGAPLPETFGDLPVHSDEAK